MVEFFHGFQVALMMTVMFNLTQFIYWRCNLSRKGNCWQKYQPVLWVFISSIMVNVQPMMLLSIGSFHLCCAKCAVFGVAEDICPTGGKNPGYTFPPWGNGLARPCSSPGNPFWDESFCDGSKLALFPTQPQGWAIQILLTWGGFVFMFIGILQATQMHKKFLNRWRAIRAGRAV